MTATAAPEPIRPGAAQSLSAYRWFQILAGGSLAWFPILFLFFLSRVTLAKGLILGTIYFLSVVTLEVPSGWLSDRYRRVVILQASATAWFTAGVLMVIAGSVAEPFPWLVAGQVSFALGFALSSGTDQSYHFEILAAEGREDEFESREARVSQLSFLAVVMATLVGGALASIDLRLAFVTTAIISVARLAMTFRMEEVEREAAPDDERGQVRASLSYLRIPLVAWLFVFLTVQQPLEGLAFDNAQPWLLEMTGEMRDAMTRTPLYAGFLVATMALIASGVAGQAPRIRQALGLKGALVSVATIEVLILFGMAATRSWFVVPLIALRSMQYAVGGVLVPAAIAPLVHARHRATFLSLGSFSGRLAYGCTALLLSGIAADPVSRFLWAGAIIGAVVLTILVLALLVFREAASDPAT